MLVAILVWFLIGFAFILYGTLDTKEEVVITPSIFFGSDSSQREGLSPFYYYIRNSSVPTKFTLGFVTSQASAIVTLYEGVTVAHEGESLQLVNFDLSNVDESPSALINQDPTLADKGRLFYSQTMIHGVTNYSPEFIIKPDVDYLIEVYPLDKIGHGGITFRVIG